MSVDDRLTRLVGEIQDTGAAVIFVSPHLDDAVLSCGALLTQLACTGPVTVLTVFSSAVPPGKWARGARKGLRDLGVANVMEHFEDRRAEDIAVLKEAGASWIHLGMTDALFRRAGGMTGMITGRSAYLTLRLDAALAVKAGVMVKEMVVTAGATTVFAPLGIGRHVDHLITRNAVAASGIDAVYYSDFPYSETRKPDARFIRKGSLQPYTRLVGRAENMNLITGYKTQVAGLFSNGMPMSPETYWLRHELSE